MHTDVKWACKNIWAKKLQLHPFGMKALGVMKDLAPVEAQVWLQHDSRHTYLLALRQLLM